MSITTSDGITQVLADDMKYENTIITLKSGGYMYIFRYIEDQDVTFNRSLVLLFGTTDIGFGISYARTTILITPITQDESDQYVHTFRSYRDTSELKKLFKQLHYRCAYISEAINNVGISTSVFYIHQG